MTNFMLVIAFIMLLPYMLLAFGFKQEATILVVFTGVVALVFFLFTYIYSGIKNEKTK